MKKIKVILNKVSEFLEIVFGYGIMLSLFLGGITFFAYMVALIIGGQVAEKICDVMYNAIFPYLIYATSIFVLLGLLKMYLCGETALKAEKKKKEKVKKEKIKK